MWSALIYIWKAGEKLSLSFALSVREEGSPYFYCSWILLNKWTHWTGKCCRAAVRGCYDFVQLCKCSVKHTNLHQLLCFLFFSLQVLYNSCFCCRLSLLIYNFNRCSESSIIKLLGSVLSDTPNIFRVQVWASFRTTVTSVQVSFFMMRWLTTATTLFLHIIF